MGVLIQILQFILSLSLLIILHEMGHFIPAKLFKCRVERFYLFFNPWFSLFKKKVGNTVYGIGWLPLGGYVKIAGMVDESMDKEAMKQPPQPDEFRSKPAWQRLIIMIGGVTVNAILAVIIWWMILLVWGKQYLPVENMTYGMAVDSLGKELGFQDGDKLVSVDGEAIVNFNEVNGRVIMDRAENVTVNRDGQLKDIAISSDDRKNIIGQMIDNKRSLFYVRIPTVIDTVPEKIVVDDEEIISPAYAAGLQKGDSIVSIDSIPTLYFDDLQEQLRANKQQQVTLGYFRNGAYQESGVMVTSAATIGFLPESELHFLTFDTIHYNVLNAWPAGFNEAYGTLVDYIKQIKLIFTREVKAEDSVGGFISIGKIFGTHWDWYRFWVMTAWLSIILAFMNLLPIPALDGGHVMFLLVEVFTGKRMPDKVLEYAQMVGMVLLFSLLIFANGADVFRLLN